MLPPLAPALTALPLPPSLPVTAALSALLAASVSDGTYRSYRSAWCQFADFCKQARLCALPASEDTVLRWIASLTARSVPLAPQTVLSYISAVRFVHERHSHPFPPAASFARFHEGYRRLHENFLLRAATPRPRRLPLPATTLQTLLRSAGGLQPAPLSVLRAVAAIAIGFVTFARGSSLALLRAADVDLSVQTRVTCKFRLVKNRQPSTPLVIFFQARDKLSRLLLLVLRLWNQRRPNMPLWLQLPGEAAPAPARASDLVSSWLQAACEYADVQAPSDGFYASHSLRKGGASSAYRAGVPFELIRRRGDWRQAATAFDLYIDGSQPASLADRELWSAYTSGDGASF